MTPFHPSPSSRETATPPMPTLGLLPVVMISAAVGGAATAQTAGEGIVLDTIQVVGQGGIQAADSYAVDRASSPKLTAPLLDTPRSVHVVTQRQIEERGASSVYDVLRTTPGVTLGTGEGGNPMGDRPFIRGYEASTDLMVDGVRSLGRTSYEAFNIEQMELVKGPGGAYSGRGGTGGSLNMVSKSARLGEEFTDLSATIGTDSQYRLQMDTNFQLGNRAAARINLFGQDAEVPGRGGIEDDKTGAALSIVGDITEATRLSFGAYHSKSKGNPDFGLPMANQAWLDATGDTRFGTGTTSDPFEPLGLLDHDKFYGSFDRDFREVTNQNAILKLEHEFAPNFRMNSQLSYIGSDQEYIVSRPTIIEGGLLDRGLRSGKKDNTTVAFSTNFSGETTTGSVEHAYAFGVEYSRDKLRSANLIGTGPEDSRGVPQGPTIEPSDPFTFSPYDEVLYPDFSWDEYGLPTITRSKSLYAFDTLKFNDQWQLNLGARYEMFDVQQQALDSDGNRADRRRKDNIWSYQAGLVYKPAPNGTIYASFGTSASPSGQCASLAGGSEGAGACTLTDGNVNLEPEKTRAYELGTKWDLMNNQLSVTAALFRTEKTNARVQNAITGEVELTGKNRAQGLELGVAGQVNDRWGIYGGYTYTDAEIIDGGGDGSTNGNDMHYIAKHSLALWTTYEVTEQWTVGGGATYTGKRFMNAANTSALPSQWRVDAMAAYKISDRANVQVNINNLFDEDLYDASHVGLFANVQAGRSVTAKLNYRF
ncbi:catecholate siderophore receptor [Paracoccus alcaliphilus]|uniref:Catecholate siderophore receptor n=2 Tax=Paracoccus alcaliphilus TaxID=34002 RepID=A0A1H8PJ45_9RHOB|nr:catecholate siderophore receptor [Paracoccus alcaliphilus]